MQTAVSVHGQHGSRARQALLAKKFAKYLRPLGKLERIASQGKVDGP
jgi:hypothetical protein